MGPLEGIRIIEIAGLGAAPFCGMMLGDMGAEVIRVDRTADHQALYVDPLARNRQSIVINLKQADGVETLLRLVETVDGLFEGFRPGVAERLGFGPETCLARNPRLVYGRLTGWGQEGPLAKAAGHDINYIALSGALHAIGRKGERPVPPLNLLGDYGGGGLLLAFGMVCGILEAQRSGLGQVIDAAMLDGSLALMSILFSFRTMGLFDEQVGTHFLSGAAHFYDTYETSDGKYVAIGSLEPQFYQQLIDKLGLEPDRFASHGFNLRADAKTLRIWDELKAEVAAVFRTKTRDEWCDLLEGTDVCFAPVLTASEAAAHPHNLAREAFIDVGGIDQNAPAPRFSRTSPGTPTPPHAQGADTVEILKSAGFSGDEIDALGRSGAIKQA